MKKRIATAGQNYNVHVPDKCPICHRFGDTQVIQAYTTPADEVQVIFQCVCPDCKNYFIGYYPPYKDGANREQYHYLIPQKPEITIFKESVEQISDKFIEIYKQAEEAKALGLDQIAGPGYRKAFEFLIKDYAITKEPDKKDDIKSSFSGEVVKKYITDSRIQAIAERALWLGNDETHYLRKWESKDIEDLIVLIRLVTDWIDIEYLSEKAIDDMPKGS